MPDDPFSSIDAICDRFEQARRSGDETPLEEWLPPDPGLRLEALVELIRIDLQLRLTAGGSARAEEYLDRFPELRASPTRVLRVVMAEYQQRRRGESTLGPDEYHARFPDLASQPGWAGAFGPRDAGPAPTLVAPDGSHPPPPSGGVAAAPDGYDLGAELGRGGMGIVYRARDRGLNRPVAVKALQPWLCASREAVGRFLDEARITGRLQHPGIPPVHHVGTLPDGRPFLAMKLIAGDTLDALLKARPDPAHDRGRFVAVFEHVCQAVACAHGSRVIHRDLKPANVMVGAFGEVQVMDWGLAKALADPESREPQAVEPPRAPGLTNPTRPGTILGTPAFMSPEQAAGAGARVDEQADVFGLGAILCAILTGRPPYTGPDSEAVRMLAARGALDPALQRLDACGAEPDLVALCKRCLAPEKADRPKDAGEVVRAVAGLREAVEARARQAQLDRVRAEGDRRAAELAAAAERRRWRVVLAAAVAVGAVLAAGAGASAWQAVRATTAEREKGWQLELTQAAEEEARTDRDRARTAEAAAHTEAANARRAEATARTAEARAVEREKIERATVRSTQSVMHFLMEAVTQGSGRGQSTPGRELNPNITLKEAMDYAARRIGGQFPDEPGMEAPLRSVVGTAYRELGAYREGEEHLRRAMELYEKVSGRDHVYAVTAAHELGRLLVAAGRYDDAEVLVNRALVGFRKLYGPDHPETLYAVTSQGWLCEARGQYAEAEALYTRALAGFEKALRPDHPSISLAAVGLAKLYAALGRHAEAEPLFKRALAREERVHGRNHRYTLQVASHLALTYRSWGRYDAAEPLFKRVLAGRENDLSPHSLPVAVAAGNLAGLYVLQERFAEAEPLFRRALAGQEKTLGPGHPATVSTAGNLAELYQIQGRFADAEPLLLAGYEGLNRAKSPGGAAGNLRRWLAGALVEVYEKTDRPEQAKDWRAELAALPPEAAPPPRPVE